MNIKIGESLAQRIQMTRGNNMESMKFSRELYPKVALIKAAYNYTDRAYLHLDADENYFYVSIKSKEPGVEIKEEEFINEMLTQAVRHEVYSQTKNIRELLLARAMATSVILNEQDEKTEECNDDEFSESTILKDWFAEND